HPESPGGEPVRVPIRWLYYLRTDTRGPPPDPDQGRNVGLSRIPDGAPIFLAESVKVWGEWQLSDLMWREQQVRSGYEFTEIPADRARALLERWVQVGRLEKYPAEESKVSPELAAYLTGLDEGAGARWFPPQAPPSPKLAEE
ncbi:MAG: hypothetical protein P8Z68_11115, partial [Kineosporiaceae bacterium]